MIRYKNPWHRSVGGPEYYESRIEPTEYRGYLIYTRNDGWGDVWDVVKDGICVGQRAGPRGAREEIDMFCDGLRAEP